MYFWWQSTVKPKYYPLKTLQARDTYLSHLCYKSYQICSFYGNMISLRITTLYTTQSFIVTDQQSVDLIFHCIASNVPLSTPIKPTEIYRHKTWLKH